MTTKYHIQLVKCQRSDDGRLTPIRGLHGDTKHLVVDATDLHDANEQGHKAAKAMGDWLQDGHAVRTGSQATA
jgi:hypothetical protein